MISSYLNEMYDVIAVNLCLSKKKKNGLTGPYPSTYIVT